MADEQGSIEIGVRIDSSDAVKGLEKIQKSLNGTGDAAGSMAKDVTTAAKQTSKQTDQAASTTVKNEEKVQAALRNTGKTAESTAKDRKKALDTTDEIVGLESLQDSTGELDSSLKGLAGAVGVVSPELEILLMRTGDLSGGLEAGARLTNLFGGSLGSLLRVLGPVTIAVTGVFVVYNKLSGGLKEAEEKLKRTHEEMREGIASAKAYEARVRSLRVRLGLLTDEEGRLRDAQDEANDLMGDRREAFEAATQRAGIFRRSLRTINDAFDVARSATGSVTVSIESLNSAMEAATAAANGEVAALELTARTFNSSEEAVSGLLAAQRLATQALAQEERAIRNYNKSLEEKRAMVLIDQALTSEDIQLMEEAREHLGAFQLDQMKLVSARIDTAIAAVRASNAADAEAAAIGRRTEATRSATDATRKEEEAQDRVRRMLAEATGGAALINFQYAESIEEISKVVMESGATEEEAAILIAAATERRRVALDELKEAEESFARSKEEVSAATVELELDAATAAKNALRDRKADLVAALQDETITRAQFAEQSLIAEEQYQTQLANIRRAKQMETIATSQMVSDTLMGLVDSNIDMVTSRLDQEEADALARAEGNMEEQEKIRSDFDKKRKQELSAAYEKKKALEIANAIISGASASIAALAAPPIGLGPVGGALLIPAIAASTAMQIATISQQTPSFHQGGVINGMGDQPITAQGGEVILNRSAVAALGGASAADSLNSGGRPGAPVIVQMTYKQRVFDQVVVDNLAKGGPLKNALNRSERRGRRGRIGGRL